MVSLGQYCYRDILALEAKSVFVLHECGCPVEDVLLLC